MNLIYIHGLDSNANSTKGLLLEKYCRQYHPSINVIRPDLNKSPVQVCELLLSLIEDLNHGADINSVDKQIESSNTVLVGSSLGGYFSTLISNQIGCPILLLNPSTQPHITLQRFSKTAVTTQTISTQNDHGMLSQSTILHTTTGGWKVTTADLHWFAAHKLSAVNHPNKVAVLLKEGDELLNTELSKTFYQRQGVSVTVQAGGDHRFSDFGKQLPLVMSLIEGISG